MIPQRRLIRTGFSNGVSCRVDACRRRLRSIRANEAQARLAEQVSESAFDHAETTVEKSAKKFSTQGQDEAGIT